jgi:CheY-like chemotaxis protein
MINDDFRILLVEDDPLLQFVFEQQVKKLGLSVHKIVGNGLDAVDTILADKYHLVFMDVRMPGLDGLSATERIRRAERLTGAYTPIVGLTAFAHRGKCLRVGMDDFLQKPIELEDLQEVIEKWKLSGGKRRANEQANAGSEQVKATTSQLKTAEKAPIVDPQDFETISQRLSNIKDKIKQLRVTFDLDRYDQPGQQN